MKETKIKILKNILGSYRREGNKQLLFECPKCDHHKYKLSVNLDINKFKCWICEYSGSSIYKLVKRFGNFKQKEAWLEVDNTVDLAEIDNLFGNSDEDSEEIIRLPEEYCCLAKKSLPLTSVYPLKYLRERGMTNDDILQWKIGYCSSGYYSNRVIVPSFNCEGKVNYFVARNYSTDFRKYLNPKLNKEKIIFNELNIDWESDIILVEGAFDAIVAGCNSIPLLGSSLREESRLFQKIVENQPPVYLCLDPDAREKAIKIGAKFLEYGLDIYMVDIDPYEDVGSMPKEAFLERKRKAELLTHDNFLFFQTVNI